MKGNWNFFPHSDTRTPFHDIPNRSIITNTLEKSHNNNLNPDNKLKLKILITHSTILCINLTPKNWNKNRKKSIDDPRRSNEPQASKKKRTPLSLSLPPPDFCLDRGWRRERGWRRISFIGGGGAKEAYVTPNRFYRRGGEYTVDEDGVQRSRERAAMRRGLKRSPGWKGRKEGRKEEKRRPARGRKTNDAPRDGFEQSINNEQGSKK